MSEQRNIAIKILELAERYKTILLQASLKQMQIQIDNVFISSDCVRINTQEFTLSMQFLNI